MIVGIHQPHYLPWLRYLDKIARSDVFVLLDTVQYTKNGWQNRNKIKSAHGWMYLTVPVLDAFGRPITEVRINNQTRWRDKHRAALVTNYSRAPFFGRYRELLEPIYRQEWELLHDVSVHTLELLLSALGIRTPLARSSTLGVSGSGTELLANICAKLGATAYLSGDYAAGNHLDIRVFKERGIGVQVQGWQCQEYRQQHLQAGFVPDLSIADLLFNEGEGSLGVLRRCRGEVFSLVST